VTTVAADGRLVLDQAVQDLGQGAARWSATPLAERIALLDRLMPRVLAQAGPMVAAASAAKGYPADSPWTAEDWASGPWAIAQGRAAARAARRAASCSASRRVRAFWSHFVSDDGLQLMQYELTIFCRRTEGYEWLAEWQYTRYATAALEVFQAAAACEAGPLALDMTDLTNFLVAAMDGLVLQYEVSHDKERCLRDLENVIRAATLLVGLEPGPATPAGDGAEPARRDGPRHAASRS